MKQHWENLQYSFRDFFLDFMNLPFHSKCRVVGYSSLEIVVRIMFEKYDCIAFHVDFVHVHRKNHVYLEEILRIYFGSTICWTLNQGCRVCVSCLDKTDKTQFQDCNCTILQPTTVLLCHALEVILNPACWKNAPQKLSYLKTYLGLTKKAYFLFNTIPVFFIYLRIFFSHLGVNSEVNFSVKPWVSIHWRSRSRYLSRNHLWRLVEVNLTDQGSVKQNYFQLEELNTFLYVLPLN